MTDQDTDTFSGRGAEIPEIDVLNEIKRVAEKLGCTPTRREFDEHARCSSATPADKFGSWRRSLRLIGREPNGPTRNSGTDDELVEDIRRIASEIGETPSLADVKDHGKYSESAYYRQFGSWTEALGQAGYTPRSGGERGGVEDGSHIDFTPERKYSTDQLLEWIREVGKDLGRRPPIDIVVEEKPPAKATYHNRFGKWSDALSEAGYSHHGPVTWIPISELVDDLLRVAEQVNSVPLGSDITEHGEYTLRNYKDQFGSWNEALQTVGLPVNVRHGAHGASQLDDRYYGQNWPVERRKALERDRYRCQDCGLKNHVSKEKYGRGLHVHHLIPSIDFERPEDANFSENLITLCEKCHDKWEPLTQREFRGGGA